jgi:hypothetical protein
VQFCLWRDCIFVLEGNAADLSAAANVAVFFHRRRTYKVDRMEKKPAPTIRDLYPHFTDEQLAEAEDAHDRYLALVLRIFERVQQTGQLTADSGELPCPLSDSRASNQKSQ